MTPKRVFITGCAGFIGSNFTHQFKKQFPRAAIVGIDDFSGGRRDAVAKGIRFYEGSVTDGRLLDKIFKKHRPEYIFHFAALPRVSYSVQHPTETSEINIIGTVTLLEKTRDFRVKRFIFSSSSAIYGNAKKLPTSETNSPPLPLTPYALHKYVDERFLKMFSDLYRLDTVALRYFNVFGPGQYGGSPYATVICNWLETLYFPNRTKPFLEDDGKQSRDFCYVKNVVAANILAMQSKKKFSGEIFNIGNGERTTLLEVKRLIEKYTGRKLMLERRPRRLGDARHTHADITKASRWLGYQPKVDFETGLRETIRWFEIRKKEG
jgi:nucleoside-diphosphate-sugar epimerase